MKELFKISFVCVICAFIFLSRFYNYRFDPMDSAVNLSLLGVAKILVARNYSINSGGSDELGNFIIIFHLCATLLMLLALVLPCSTVMLAILLL